MISSTTITIASAAGILFHFKALMCITPPTQELGIATGILTWPCKVQTCHRKNVKVWLPDREAVWSKVLGKSRIRYLLGIMIRVRINFVGLVVRC